jgi:hypothetical protein
MSRQLTCSFLSQKDRSMYNVTFQVSDVAHFVLRTEDLLLLGTELEVITGFPVSFSCFSLTTVYFDITPLAGFPTWKGRYVLCSLLTRQDGYFCCCDGVVLNTSSAGEGMILLRSPNSLLPKMLPRTGGCTVLGVFMRGLG